MDIRDYLKTNSKKHIIFDFDATLYLLHLPWEEIYLPRLQSLLREMDKELFNEQEFEYVLLNQFLKKHGKKAKQKLVALAEEFEIKYLERVSKNIPLINFVKTNKDKYRFYIWSSNTKKVINQVLEKEKMIGFFDIITTMDEIDFFKPSANGFMQMYNKNTQKKEEYLMVGDSINDEKASREAGIDFLKVRYF